MCIFVSMYKIQGDSSEDVFHSKFIFKRKHEVLTRKWDSIDASFKVDVGSRYGLGCTSYHWLQPHGGQVIVWAFHISKKSKTEI